MRNQHSRRLLGVLLLVSCGLAGCGTVVPNIKEAWDSDYPGDAATNTPPIMGAAQIEFEIKKQIYCELKEAVTKANSYAVIDTEGKKVVDTSSLLPLDSVAQVSLSLTVDESSAVSPGVTFNNPMANAISTFGVVNKTPVTISTPQFFNLGVGGALSSTATRVDKFDPSYSIAYLLKPVTANGVCHPENDPFLQIGFTPAKSSPLIPLIESNLGLTDWLIGAMFTNRSIPSVLPEPKPVTPKSLADERAKLLRQGYTPAEVIQILASKASNSGSGGGSSPKPDTVSIEIKFIIVSSGNVTPTWKLVRVSANTGSGPFFSTGRTRTHDVIITIGPNTTATNNTHLASQIGNAVGNANRSLLVPSSPNTFTPFAF